MAQIPKLLFLLPQIILHLLLPLTTTAASINASTTGFSFKLIHRDSIHFPFRSRVNLTTSEIIRRDVASSKVRALWLSLKISGDYTMDHRNDGANLVQPNNIRPHLSYHQYHHVVSFTLGTPPQTYFLEFDTGNDLLWIQCNPCNPCLDQSEPLFDPRSSSTYAQVPSSDPICTSAPLSRSGRRCTYSIDYLDGGSTSGNLGRESFVFPLADGSHAAIPNLLFGCTHAVTNMRSGGFVGILGMGGGRLSLASQVSSLTAGRFSYCLLAPSQARSRSGFLRFGEDIRYSSRDQSIHFEPPSRSAGIYYLELVDLSLDNNPLHIPPGTFARSRRGRGGCIIDTGATYTHLVRRAYDIVKHAMINYFEMYGIEQTTGTLDLCFQLVEGFTDFPSLTFHFGSSANFKVERWSLFVRDRSNQALCLAILPHNYISIVGAYQQTNVRFIYDLGNQVIKFRRENCLDDTTG